MKQKYFFSIIINKKVKNYSFAENPLTFYENIINF